MGDDLDTLLALLAEHAAAAEQADATADQHRQAIRDLLPKARAEGAGPAQLERVIHGIYVAGTISRWTKDAAPPRGTRKGVRKAAARPVPGT